MSRQSLSDLARGSVLVFSDGYRTRQDQLDPNGIPILRVAEVTGSVLRPADGDRVSASLRSKMGVKTSRPGDVLVTTKGTVGRVAMVPPAFPEHVYSPQLCFLRVLDPSQIDPGWLYCWARSPEFLDQVSKYSGQTDMAPYLSLRDLGSIKIEVPSLDEQRRIAGALGVLDDLIEVNRKLIANLRELAQALYQQAIANGAIPTTVEAIATFENNKRVPLSAAERSASPGVYPYYGATGQMDSVGGYLFDGVRVLIGEDGSVVRANGTPFVQFVDGRFWVNNHAHVLVGRGISTSLLRVVLESANVASVVTGAVQPKLSMGNLKSVPVKVPNDPAIDSAVQRLAEAELGLREEIRQLELTRDELLPLLMSGRVRVGDVAA